VRYVLRFADANYDFSDTLSVCHRKFVCQRNYPTQAKRRLEWATQLSPKIRTGGFIAPNQRLSEFGKASNDGRRVFASCRGSGVSCHGPCDRGSLVPRVWDHLTNERCAGSAGLQRQTGHRVRSAVFQLILNFLLGCDGKVEITSDRLGDFCVFQFLVEQFCLHGLSIRAGRCG
jgi:hypothetical protein